MNGVKFMNDVHFMNNVQFMPSVNIMKDVQLMPDVTGLQNVTPYSDYKPRRVYSVNDSYEKANSLLDVLLGDTQNRVLLEEKGLGWAADIPILDKLTGISVLINDKYLEPIENLLYGKTTLEQAGKEIFFNTLIEVGEDLDIFSNIIKSQDPAAGGEPGLESLKSSLGYGGIRKVYNFNTGNFLLDLTGEMLSDPLTVLELGSKVLLKSQEQTFKASIKSIIKNTYEEVSWLDNVPLTDKAINKLTNAIYKKVVKEGITSYDELLKVIKDTDTLKALSNSSFSVMYPKITSTITSLKGYKAYNAISNFYKGVDKFDKMLTTGVWAATPVLPFKYLVKPAAEKAIKHIYNYVIDKLNSYPILQAFTKKQAIYKELRQQALFRNIAIFETMFKNENKFLAMLKLSAYEFEEYVYSFLKEYPEFFNGTELVLSDENIDKFTTYLSKVNKNVNNAIKNLKDINGHVYNLLLASSPGVIGFYKVENEITKKYTKAKINSLNKYITKHSEDLEKIYNYIDKNTLTHNGINYGLKNINEFLTALISDQKASKSVKIELSNLLDTLNVNKTTAPKIANILSSNNKNKNIAIRKIIAKYSGADSLFESKYYKNVMNKVQQQVKTNIDTTINRAWRNEIATYNEETYKHAIKNSYENVQQAVENLQKYAYADNHAVTYIGNAIRLQDMPPANEVISELRRTINLYQDIINKAKHKSDRKIASNGVYIINAFKSATERSNTFIPNLYIPSDYIVDKTTSFLTDTERLIDEIFLPDKRMLRKPTIAYDIINWYQNLPDAYKALKELEEGFSFYGDAESVQLCNLLDRTIKGVDTLLNSEIKDNIVNYVTNITGMIQPQASHLNMFNILTQHTHFSSNHETKFVLDVLSDSNSYYRRTLIPSYIKVLTDANRPNDVIYVNKLLSQVDTVTNLNKLLAEDINVPFDLSEKTNKSLKTIIFDSIDNHKDYLLVDILNEDNYIFEEEIKSGPNKGYKYLTDSTGKEIKDIRTYTEFQNKVKPKRYKEALVSEIINRIKNTDSITKELIAVSNNTGIAYDQILLQIQDESIRILYDYIEMQSQILNYMEDITLSTLYDLNSVKIINTLNNINFKDLLRYTDLHVEQLNLFQTFKYDLNKFAEGIQLGIDDIKYIDRKIGVPLKALEARNILKNYGIQYNLYSASIESQMYTAKYLLRESFNYNEKHIEGFEEIFHLTPDNFIGTNEEFIMLEDKLWAYKDVLHEQYKYKPEYYERLREALIRTYRRPRSLFAPMNPTLYFNSLDAEQLLAWEIVTNSNMSLNNKHHFTEELKMLGYDEMLKRNTTSKMLSDLDAAMRNMGTTDDEMISHFAEVSRESGAAEYIYDTIDANLMYTLHDLNDLNENTHKISKFIKQDVAARNDITNTIIKIEKDTRRHNKYSIIGNPDDLYKLFGVTYGYEDSLDIAQHYQYLERSNNMARNIASFNAEELATFLSLPDSPGALVFRNADIVRTLNPDGSTTWSGLSNIFNFSKKELDDAGLKIMKETIDDVDWYIIRLTDNRPHKKQLTWVRFKSGFDYEIQEGKKKVRHNIQSDYDALIDKYKAYLNLDYSNEIPTTLIKVESLNEDTWNTFMDRHYKFFGDSEERKLYQKLTPQGNSSFFNKSFERLNLAVFGGGNTYNIWNSMYSKNFVPRSTQLAKNTYGGLMAMLNRENKIVKYLTLFFNDDFSLNNPLIRALFSESTDQNVREFFTQGKYHVAVLKQDSQGLPKVFEYYVSNRKSLDAARKAGGILVPTDTFNAMRSVVNKRKMTNNLLDVYRRAIMPTYKSMYLYTLGFEVRNAFDTLFMKTGSELGGLTELPATFKYELAASKALELHNEIQQKVMKETAGQTFNKETLLEVLAKNYTKEEADLYFLTDLFVESEASGGLSKSLGDYLEEFNKKGVDDIRAKWEIFWEEKILFGKQPLNPLHLAGDINNHIEQTGRFGMFLGLVDNGLPIDESIERVIKTHFNYRAKSDIMEICERIFWFSTFPINNINYYVNGGLTQAPTMLKLLMDAQTASWNNGEYTYEELKKTNFLAYQAMAGNIRIGNKIIKLSPSLFDFLGLVTNAPQNLIERLNPIMSIPMNLDNLEEELNPLQTQFRLFPKQFQGNPVPSLISDINKYDWDRVFPKWRNNYKRKQSNWTKYPKITNPKATKKYIRKYYSRRYYTNVRKVSRTSLYHDAVNYYRIGGRNRGITYRDL